MEDFIKGETVGLRLEKILSPPDTAFATKQGNSEV